MNTDYKAAIERVLALADLMDKADDAHTRALAASIRNAVSGDTVETVEDVETAEAEYKRQLRATLARHWPGIKARTD